MAKSKEPKKKDPEKIAKHEEGPVGWRCPVCGRGNSPYTTTCPCVLSAPTVIPYVIPRPWYPADPNSPYYRQGPTCGVDWRVE